MDKAFGIRHPDHTAFNRGYSGFGLSQNDQTHGLLLHYNQQKYDLVSHFFVGNLNQDKELRQVGFSLMGRIFCDRKSWSWQFCFTKPK